MSLISPGDEDTASVNDSDTVFIDRDDISNYNSGQILPEAHECIRKIRSWLQPTSYDDVGGEYRKHRASYLNGTGAWLTSSDVYREWLHGHGHAEGLLWIKGLPGSGKSVMAAKLIDELARSNPGCPVLFFFFRQIIEANHKPQALLRDWMDQLLEYSPPLQKQLKTYVDANRPADTVLMEDMWKHLRAALADLPGKAFCIADALDEMDQGHDMDMFLKELASLGQWRPGTVKVLMTSRPVPTVERPLRMAPCLHLRLLENLVDVDISTYVEYTLSTCDWSIQASDKQLIRDAVPGRANGLFLYAKLAMDAFLQPGADINQVLLHLPVDLNALYNNLLEEHARRANVPTEVQRLVLQAITHTSRPLRLLELATMVELVSPDGPDGSKRGLKATKDLIRAACGPLLEILPDETVSVIHHSFTEFLKGIKRSDHGSSEYPILKPGPTHSKLALACLRYLQTGCLDAVDSVIKQRNGSRCNYMSSWNQDDEYPGFVPAPDVQLRLQYPFVEYAVGYWHHHINKSEAAGHEQTRLNPEIAKFLEDSKVKEAWLHLSWSENYPDKERITQLHIAARAGFVSYVKELLGSIEPDAQDAAGKTPLWWAAAEGHEETIRVLIAAGANPDQADLQCGFSPLHYAAGSNHYSIVKALLDSGVEPLPSKPTGPDALYYRRCLGYAYLGDSPLEAACLNGCLETVSVLLSYIQDIHVTQRALAWAAGGGQSKVVTSLLQHPGVDVNFKVDGATPIYLACKAYSVPTVEILLQAGADPSIRCEDGRELNCLHRICHVGDSRAPMYADADVLSKIFLLLIQHGVDVNDRTTSGMTALHGAVVGSSVLTQLLVDAGADANARDNQGATPLYKTRGYIDAFRTPVDPMVILIEQGHADINNIRADGDTVLHWMLNELPAESVLTFLKYGPECNVLDGRGNNPLHRALRRHADSPAVIEGLLKAGADPNMKNRDGLAPLLCLGSDNNLRSPNLVDIILAAGADPNTVDRDGKSLWFRLLPVGGLLWHDERALERLRDRVKQGASTSTRDFKGRTILHEVVQTISISATGNLREEMPSKAVLDIVADLGLDFKAVDYAGNSLLHELASREDNHDRGSELIPLWRSLVALGLDLEQKNHAGRTPLHVLCAFDECPPYFNLKRIVPIDLLISRAKNLDNADNKGITPLHIAATRGELYTKKLLDAGADPTACTQEGLTALHLASRCGQSNVVGILLAALGREIPAANINMPQPRESSARLMRKSVPGVNAKAYERDEITPLFYACRSGRPETVALLIEAGADATTGKVLQACAAFEAEGHLWKLSQRSMNHGQGNEDGRFLLDNPRPVSQRRRRYRDPIFPDPELSTTETSRIEEILSILVTARTDLSQPDCCGPTNSLIDEAVAAGRDYTARCLVEVRDKCLSGLDTARPGSVTGALFGPMHHFVQEASVQTLNVSGLVEQGAANQELFRYFLSQRQYYLVEELARLGADFLCVPGDKQSSNLALLVRDGLYVLAEKVGNLVAESKLNTADWHAFGDDTRPGLWFAKRDISDPKHTPVPFLLEAVQRELPNLDMVRLLVERFRVDINELRVGFGGVRIPREIMYNTLVPADSALHYAARGYSWWHAHQALPYLLKAGADINVRGYEGDTPLHVSLWEPGSRGPFAKDAARILIENGADVNAVGYKGRSCLVCAADDVEMTKLLVDHGATITAEAIFAAINARNVAGVNELLSHGANPSMRRRRLSTPEFDADGRRTHSHSFQVTRLTGVPLHHEVFPLYHAVMASGLGWWRAPGPADEVEFDLKIVEALLDHGADPFAKFLSQINKFWEASSVTNTAKDTPSLEVPEAHRECTILHELLLAGSVADPFLNIPGLDVNHRDAKGRTLFLAACEGSKGPDLVLGTHKKEADRDEQHVTMFQRLISLSAELRARDNSGRNVLHHMIAGNFFDTSFCDFKDSLASVVREAPDLIHQSDDDGQTPLHYAISRADISRDASTAQALLSAGANPFVVDKNDNNVLHVLAKSLDASSQLLLFQDLVRRGVDFDGRNHSGETPLFIFCKNDKTTAKDAHCRDWQKVSDKDALLMLQELGADLFARDAKGRGLLHLAARNNDAEWFKLLMDAGLDAMLEDEAQQTAIDIAAVSGNQKVLQLFEKNAGSR